jgi:hypothetical protein
MEDSGQQQGQQQGQGHQQGQQQQQQQLFDRVHELLADESEELLGKVGVAVAKLSADEKQAYQHMPDPLLRATLKQLAQQPAGGLCVSSPPPHLT